MVPTLATSPPPPGWPGRLHTPPAGSSACQGVHALGRHAFLPGRPRSLAEGSVAPWPWGGQDNITPMYRTGQAQRGADAHSMASQSMGAVWRIWVAQNRHPHAPLDQVHTQSPATHSAPSGAGGGWALSVGAPRISRMPNLGAGFRAPVGARAAARQPAEPARWQQQRSSADLLTVRAARDRAQEAA